MEPPIGYWVPAILEVYPWRRVGDPQGNQEDMLAVLGALERLAVRFQDRKHPDLDAVQYLVRRTALYAVASERKGEQQTAKAWYDADGFDENAGTWAPDPHPTPAPPKRRPRPRSDRP